MSFKSRGFVMCLILLLTVVVIGGGHLYLNQDSMRFKKKMASETKVHKENTTNRPLNTGVFVVTNDLEQHKGIYSAFTSVGYDVLSGDFNIYEENTDYNGVFIFTEKEIKFLEDSQIEKIKKNIENGQKAIVTGDSKLAEKLGIKVKSQNRVKSYVVKGSEEQKIQIEGGVSSYEFEVPKDFISLAKDTDGEDVITSGSIGKGKIIYLGSDIAPESGPGYTYYPLFLDTFNKEFNLAPVYSRNNGGIYVDIGYHMGYDTPAEVAEKAKSYGYDQINVGVWSSLKEDTVKYYKEMIEECHKRGIKVFAWFELPMVSIEFWDKHPEWRQKTASGKDAQIDWRYLMALEDEDCFNAVKKDIKQKMEMFDFDGIDIAEIYYEAPNKGLEDEELFTPMNDAFREDFKKKYGFDPKEVFSINSKYYWRINKEAKNKVLEERINLITTQHREVLDVVKEIKKEKPYLETMVTIIDSVTDKRMREDIGLDSNEIVKLQNEYDFTLNIEDPFTLWGLGPGRYSIIGEGYRNIMSENQRLYIDINIVERSVYKYPTKKQRGIEVYSLIHNASRHTNKVIMYALSTLEEEDMALAPFAYVHDVTGKETSENTYEFDSKNSFIWNLDLNGKEVYIDNKKYPVYTKEKVIIPFGRHKVEIKDSVSNSIKVTDINSNIKEAFYEGGTVKINYVSDGRCFINIDKMPKEITLDGEKISPEIKKINETYTIFLPSGDRNVTIE